MSPSRAVLEPAEPPAEIRIDRERNPGEPYVWVTSMGLAVALGMILSLLAVITMHGLNVFWPKEVALIELKNGAAAAGEIVKKQTKTQRVMKDGVRGKPEIEWQIYTGNREVFGLAFRYLDAAAMTAVSYHRDILVIERLEHGDAIGFPFALEFAGGRRLNAAEPGFDRELQKSLEGVRARWKEIRRIEKRDIGRINDIMERIRIREKTLKRQDAPSLAFEPLRALMAELQKQFDVLAAAARKLRQEQKADMLRYRLADGGEKSLVLGQIVDFYYPNRLDFLDKLSRFAANVRNFVAGEPREANTEGGIFPAIFGTFIMTVLMSAAVVPFGVLAAIYLREYAKQGFFLRCVRIAVNNLAGVPSIVFGVFGLGFFVYTLGGSIDQLFFKDALPSPTFGTGGILWASLTLALMTVPVVIVATEEAIAAVPRGMREGSLACGASKWQTVQRVVLPASAPGIMTGLILAMARGAGEVAPLMIVGVVKLAPSLPLDAAFPYLHLDRKFMHLGFHIYDLGFQSPDSEAAKPMVFATTLALILLIVVLNLAAFRIRVRLRKRFAMGAF